MLVRFVGCAACTTILDGDIAQDLLDMRAAARPGWLVASSARDFSTHRSDGIHPAADPNPFGLFLYEDGPSTKQALECCAEQRWCMLARNRPPSQSRPTLSARLFDEAMADAGVNIQVPCRDHDHQLVITVSDAERAAPQTVADI